MPTLLNSLNSVLTAGIGGIAFLGAWGYMMLRWLGGNDFFIGNGNFLGWLP